MQYYSTTILRYYHAIVVYDLGVPAIKRLLELAHFLNAVKKPIKISKLLSEANSALLSQAISRHKFQTRGVNQQTAEAKSTVVLLETISRPD